jgi:hypothetical protein
MTAATPARTSWSPAQLNRLLRKVHLYLGVFFAPVILLFALTGALQVYGLHEAGEGGYKPAPIIEKLGQVHIHQRFALKPKRPERAAAPAPAAPAAAKPAPPREAEKKADPAKVLLKALFFAAAVGLAASTVLGVWISLLAPRGRGLILGLLAAGAVLPILLLAL